MTIFVDIIASMIFGLGNEVNPDVVDNVSGAALVTRPRPVTRLSREQGQRETSVRSLSDPPKLPA